MATELLTVRRHVRFSSGERGRRKLRAATPETPPASQPVPRISRLMALAIVLDEMVRSGQVASYQQLAQLCHISKTRICQIMALVGLAPEIQEAVLFLQTGTAAVTERNLRHLVVETDWEKQRAAWDRLHS